MKTTLALFCLLAVSAISNANAQGTVEFNAHLTSPYTDYTGTGVFTLSGDLFTYELRIRFASSFSTADIRGPGSDPDAPVQFSLTRDYCMVGGPGGIPEGGCFFEGCEQLTMDQIDDLTTGRWQVWAYSTTAPSIPLSGQIVPEPGALGLWALLGVVLFSMIRSRSTTQ